MGCMPGRNTAQTAAAKTNTMDSTLPVSATTRMFMQELENEMKATKKEIRRFVPSARLVDKYNLSKRKRTYYIHGFIKTDGRFDELTFKKAGFSCGRSVGGIRTVQVPLKSFYIFLRQKGITYFQIAEKLSHDNNN
jgi:hypothetical protein